MNPKLNVTWTLSEGASIMKLWDLDLRNFPVEKLSKEETDRIRAIGRASSRARV